MQISRLCVLCMVFFCLFTQAQFETDYKPVTSTGELPKDFVTLSSQKYLDAKSNLSSKEKGHIRKKKSDFLLESNFSIDNVLLSGNVLFNDPLADYVNKVADYALASEPQVRKELRFYVLKSTAVNAFATNQGIIFITMGMLAQVENEAQLAFVIDHEATHYIQKHAIEEFIQSDDISKGKGAYNRLSLDEKIMARCAFSQEKEKEADEKGLLIFLKSKYSTGKLIGVYDVLKYSYLPFDDVAFDKSIFENSTLKIPDEYLKKSTLAVDTKDIEDDDPRSTHPSIKSRHDKTLESIKNADNSQKMDYQVGENQFNHTQEVARFELCRLYTLKRRYEAGIYTAFLLTRKYPNNLYLKKNIAFCLGGLAQYSNQEEFSDVHHNSDSIEGKWQAVFYMMYKFDSAKGDMNVIALAYVTKLKVQYPDDPEITELYNSLLHSLVASNRMYYNDFSAIPLNEVLLQASLHASPQTDSTYQKEPEPQPANTNEKSKYDKLREQKTVETISYKYDPGRYTKYAFVEYMDKDWFKKDFTNAKDLVKKKESVDLDAERNKSGKYWDSKTYALGAEKVVVVDPYFARINARKKEKYKYIASESGQVDFTERLKQNARQAKLGIEVLNTKNLKENETEKLNDVAVLKDYISERLAHNKDIELPYAERARILALAQKYGTDYFMWTGNISLTDKNRYNAFLMAYSILFPPLLLYTLPKLISAGQYTLYFAMVYDVKTDEIKLAAYREVENRTRGYILNSHIYDVFSQIKSSKK